MHQQECERVDDTGAYHSAGGIRDVGKMGEAAAVTDSAALCANRR
jgi:hypothetical protein